MSRAIGACRPQLKYLFLVSEASVDGVVDMMESMMFLQVVDVTVHSWEDMVKLGRLVGTHEALRSLTLTSAIGQRSGIIHRSTTTQSHNSLRHIKVTGSVDDLASIAECLGVGLQVESLEINLDQRYLQSGDDTFSPVIQSFQRNFPNTRHLVVAGSGNFSIPGSALDTLALLSLTTCSITFNCDLFITPSALRNMAASSPNLERLRLMNSQHQRNTLPSPTLTLMDVLDFALQLPRLQSLGLDMDASYSKCKDKWNSKKSIYTSQRTTVEDLYLGWSPVDIDAVDIMIEIFKNCWPERRFRMSWAKENMDRSRFGRIASDAGLTQAGAESYVRWVRCVGCGH